MKTVTLSNDHCISLLLAIRARIEYLEGVMGAGDDGIEHGQTMFLRDQLEVARQALDAMSGNQSGVAA